MARVVVVALLLAACGGARNRAAEEARAEGAVTAPPRDDPSYRDDEIDVVLRTMRDDLASCVPFSSEPFPIDVLVASDGRFQRDESTLMAAETAACLDAALARVRMPRPARLGRMITIDVAEVYRIDR
jgi:hypothetical protein